MRIDKFTTTLLFICLLLVSCQPKTIPIQEINAASPTVFVQTSTPTIIPTKDIPTPTPIPNGLVDPNSIEEFYYTQMKIYKVFPSQWIVTLPKELKEVVGRMYKDHKFLEGGGLEIYPANNSVVTIGPSTINDEFTTFSIYLNNVERARIKVSPGTLIYFITERAEVPEESMLWCFYSPDDSSCIHMESNFEKNISLFPNGLAVYFDEQWRPYVKEEWDSSPALCWQEYANATKQIIIELDGPMSESELVRVYTASHTYRLPNTNIYSYGPSPLACPYIQIMYPKNTVLWDGYKLELGVCPFPVDESLGDPKENGCIRQVEEYYATPFGSMNLVDFTYCAVFDKFGNMIDVDTTPTYGMIDCLIGE